MTVRFPSPWQREHHDDHPSHPSVKVSTFITQTVVQYLYSSCTHPALSLLHPLLLLPTARGADIAALQRPPDFRARLSAKDIGDAPDGCGRRSGPEIELFLKGPQGLFDIAASLHRPTASLSRRSLLAGPRFSTLRF